MTRILIFLLILVSLGIGGYLLLSNNAGKFSKINTSISKQPLAVPTIAKSGVSIVLSPINGSGVTGLATIVEKNGKVFVDIKVVNPPFVQQPASLNAGTCLKSGKVEFQLKNVFHGSSETTFDSNMEKFNKLLPLALNIYKSEEELSVVSCGQISIKK